MGELEALPPPPYQLRPNDLELVCASSQGRHGGLSVLRRGVVAEVMGRAALKTQCRGVWVLPSVPEDDDMTGNGPTADGLSGFMVVAAQDRTLVIRYQGQRFVQMPEPEDVGFKGTAPTHALGAVGGGRGLVQVYGGEQPGLRLVWDGQAANEMVMQDERDIGGLGLSAEQRVASVSFQDPFILLVLSDGTLVVLAVDGEEGAFVPCDLPWPDAFRAASPITAASLFEWYPPALRLDAVAAKNLQVEEAAAPLPDEMDEQDEEAFLYGPTWATANSCSSGADKAGMNGDHMMDVDNAVDKAGQGTGADVVDMTGGGVYCALCRADGSLEVYAIPSAELVFTSRRCTAGPPLLRNGLLFPSSSSSESTPHPSSPATTITEIRVASVGPLAEPACYYLERMVLALWTSTDDLLVYVARPLRASSPADGLGPALPLSWAKVPHDLICRTPRHLYAYTDAVPTGAAAPSPLRRLHPFSAVGGQRGLFVGGRVPAWILAERGTVTVQPATLRQSYVDEPPSPHRGPSEYGATQGDEVVNGFAPFADADNGFVVLRWRPSSVQGMLDVCSADMGPLLGYTAATGAVTGASCTVRKVRDGQRKAGGPGLSTAAMVLKNPEPCTGGSCWGGWCWQVGPLGVEVKRLASVPGAAVPTYVMVVAKHGRGGAEHEEDVGEDEGQAGRHTARLTL